MAIHYNTMHITIQTHNTFTHHSLSFDRYNRSIHRHIHDIPWVLVVCSSKLGGDLWIDCPLSTYRLAGDTSRFSYFAYYLERRWASVYVFRSCGAPLYSTTYRTIDDSNSNSSRNGNSNSKQRHHRKHTPHIPQLCDIRFFVYSPIDTANISHVVLCRLHSLCVCMRERADIAPLCARGNVCVRVYVSVCVCGYCWLDCVLSGEFLNIVR